MAKVILGSWPRHLKHSGYLGIRDSTAPAPKGPANTLKEQSQEAAELSIKSLYFTQQDCGQETGSGGGHLFGRLLPENPSLRFCRGEPDSGELETAESQDGLLPNQSPAFCVDAIDCHMSLRRFYNKH